MPRRSTPDLSPARRQTLVAELRMHGELEDRASLDKYVHVSRAFDAGMTVRDIADVYGVSSSTATRWKEAGERERERRRRGGAERDPQSG
jgi:DNA invertase Pin-like site-specific DNA recombinase